MNLSIKIMSTHSRLCKFEFLMKIPEYRFGVLRNDNLVIDAIRLLAYFTATAPFGVHMLPGIPLNLDSACDSIARA